MQKVAQTKVGIYGIARIAQTDPVYALLVIDKYTTAEERAAVTNVVEGAYLYLTAVKREIEKISEEIKAEGGPEVPAVDFSDFADVVNEINAQSTQAPQDVVLH